MSPASSWAARVRLHLRHPVVFSLAVLTTAVHGSPAGSSLAVGPASTLPAQVSPLDPAEEADPALLAIAGRFNPAMALPIREIWPVELRYAWHDGADLIARVEGDDAAADRVAVPNRDLGRVDWSGLPARTAAGRDIRYYIDAPGDDRVDPRTGTTSWRQRFAAIAQPQGDGAAPVDSPYPPTQYVHAYWWNRAQGLLAIQYWFYYPYNEWVNHHEGDWEHVQIILQGSHRIDSQARFTSVAHHYFFHDFWTAAAQVLRFGGAAPDEDHALVYVGGHGELFGFSGAQSGGSYPLPARYPAAGFALPFISPDEDTSRPARFIAASDFRLVLLPEPSRLDARRSPELSWLRVPFYVGQRAVYNNPPGLGGLCGRPPLQPAARIEWLNPAPLALWPGQVVPVASFPAEFHWPSSWACAAGADPRTCLGGRVGPGAGPARAGAAL
jgi:hypothetical protein